MPLLVSSRCNARSTSEVCNLWLPHPLKVVQSDKRRETCPRRMFRGEPQGQGCQSTIELLNAGTRRSALSTCNSALREMPCIRRMRFGRRGDRASGIFASRHLCLCSWEATRGHISPLSVRLLWNRTIRRSPTTVDLQGCWAKARFLTNRWFVTRVTQR